MMSLGVAKGGVIPPTDEDRRRIIRQMKVRTTLKGDKSWIHHHNSDSEEEKKSSPLSRQAGRGSPASTPTAPQSDRSAAAKPQAGYLIRGVFTRTIDKTSSVSNSSPSNEVQKSTATKGQSLSRPSSGYRMTTEDYKKLAPYNVKQKSADMEEEDAPFSPDEHKKRTEAANSVLRSSASRERAYVLSAAKKSNGSPTQEFPPLFAKRIEIEEEEAQQRRSSAVSGSCRSSADDNSTNGLRKNTTGLSWNEPKTTAAAAPSSPERGSESQRATSLSVTPERTSTSTEFRNGDTRQAPHGKSSSEMVSQHGEGSSLPPPTERAPVHLEEREYSFKRSVLGYEERSSTQEGRSSNPEAPAPSKPYWSEATSSQDFKEVNTPRERGHSQTWPSDDSKPELTPGFLDSNNHSEKEQEPPAQDAHPEPPLLKEPSMPGSLLGFKDSPTGSTDINKGLSPGVQSEEATSKRSSSLPRESSITAPETPGKEAAPCQERLTPAYEEQPCPTTQSHPESLGDWRHSEPTPVAPSRSNFSSKGSAYETQPFPSSLPAPSHRIPAYVDSQMLSSRRPTPDYEGRVYDGRSSPRNSRYDSTSAWVHCEFNSPAARHDSLPRDTTMSLSPRSHRVPFYMDSLNYNSTRLLSSSSERLCSPMATLPHNSSATSGYQPEASTAGKGVLFVKEYVNSSGLAASPRYGSGSLVDLSNLERGTYSHHSYLASTPLQRSIEPLCSYCSREIRDCPKIIIEHLNIYCHEYCFRCGICHKAMGDLLDKIFIHRDIVHCDKCYEKLF
ncbi:zinc finger protein 185 [Phaethornis superciliosus]